MSNLGLATQIRDTQTDPTYLQGYNGVRYMYTMRLMSDLLLEKLNQGMRAHMPGEQVDPSVIPFQAADRLIVQGPAETPQAFVARLQKAIHSWSRAGSRVAIMEQVQAFLQETNTAAVLQFPEIAIVSGNSSETIWDVIYNRTAIGAPPAHTRVAPSNWNWDGTYRRWWAWMILYDHLVATGQSGTAATFNALAGTLGLGHNVLGVWIPSGTTTSDGPFVTITGLSGITNDNILQWITFSNVASPGNAQTVQISSVISSTSCTVAMPSHVIADANNGSIHWSISKYQYIVPGPAWGTPAFLWGDISRSIGLTLTAQYVQSIRKILALWKKADTYYQSIIFSFDGADGSPGAMFSPLSSPGSGNPNGTWGSPGLLSASGVWEPARVCNNVYDCFADGTGKYLDCAVPNVT